MAVVVGPYQRIVAVNWPEIPPSNLVEYIITDCYFRAKTNGGGMEDGDDGIVYSAPPSGSSYLWLGGYEWELLPSFLYGLHYFNNLQFYSDTGALLASGTDTSLGAVVTKPVLPQIIVYPEWTMDGLITTLGVFSNSDWTAGTATASTLFPSYTSGGGVFYFNARQFTGTPEKYKPPVGGPTYWMKYASVGAVEQANPLDVNTVSVSYGGKTYACIGANISRSFDFGGYYVCRILLRATA